MERDEIILVPMLKRDISWLRGVVCDTYPDFEKHPYNKFLTDCLEGKEGLSREEIKALIHDYDLYLEDDLDEDALLLDDTYEKLKRWIIE